MGISLSKTVRIRVENSTVLANSADIHGPELEPEVAALFQKVGLPPPAPGAVKQVLNQGKALLGAATQQIVELEMAYVGEQADDEAPRLDRDEAAALVADQIGEARTILGAGGAGRLQPYGLDGPIPGRPADLHAYATTAIDLLTKADQTLTLLGTPLNTRTLAVSLTPAVETLGAALTRVGVEERELQLALEKRDLALADWSRVYQSVATILSSLYRLAGRTTLADKVRPTERQVQGRESPSDPADAPAATAPQPAAPAKDA